MAELVLEGVSLRYGERPALDAIDLTIPDGQLVSVVGPSGGGKTSLLRAIAGLERPSAGRITFDGRNVIDVPAHLRGFGLMFQDYALFPHRDVAGNVGFGLRMAGWEAGRIRERVAEMLTLVGLPGVQSRSVAQLSGGEQQRVALARALAPGPRLLMLDEPMGSLDRALRDRLPTELRRILGSLGVTVLYVTHDQEEAFSVADRTIVLHDGRIEADGSPEELWTRPPSGFVARFLGFRNVATAEVQAGVAVTPWGTIAAAPGTPDGPCEVVIRPDALELAPAGPIRGTVATLRFRGDHVLVALTVAGAPDLELEVRGARPPALNQVVHVRVDPRAVVTIRRPPPGRAPTRGTLPHMNDAATPTMPREGDPAPEFTLPDDTGTPRSLSEMRGRWLVLYFYPKDDTPGCTTESCQFRDSYALFRDTDAEVWGISILGSSSKAAFKAKFGLPYTLLADEHHTVAETYGTWVEKDNYGKKSWGVKRSTFLIDPKGRIARVWGSVKADGHADQVLAQLAELRAAV